MKYLALLALLFTPSVVGAASLNLTPAQALVDVGGRVTIQVVADTAGQMVTAAEGEVRYDPAVLEPELISTSGSIFTMWATEPDVTAPGTVSFSGWVSAPVSGVALPVVSLTFLVKAEGAHALALSSGALLAFDGKGSNIISSLGRGEIVAKLQDGGRVLGVSTIDVPPPPPTFTVHSEVAGDKLMIVGEVEQGSRVYLTLLSERGERRLSGEAPTGVFTIVDERLEAGKYTLFGETYSEGGVASVRGPEQEFTIRQRTEIAPLAAAFLGAPSYVTLLVGLLSFMVGFLAYWLLARAGYLP